MDSDIHSSSMSYYSRAADPTFVVEFLVERSSSQSDLQRMRYLIVTYKRIAEFRYCQWKYRTNSLPRESRS